jgi:hypothetical protein
MRLIKTEERNTAMLKQQHLLIYLLSLIIVFIVSLLLSRFQGSPEPGGELDVTLVTSPDGKEVVVGQQVAIVAEATGLDLEFKWNVVRGTISKTEGQSIIYTAPAEPGLDVVDLIVISRIGSATRTAFFNIILNQQVAGEK